jgi:hypothetical protein
MALFRPGIHASIFTTCLALILVGMPLSKFLISVGMIALFVNWLLEGSLLNKIKNFLRNTPALLFSSVFLVHLVSGFYTESAIDWYNAIRVKIPLMLLPLVFSTTSHFRQSWVKPLWLLFSLAVLFKCSLALGTYYGWWGKGFSDVRDITRNISPIRLALMGCLAASGGLFIFRKNKSILAAFLLLFVFLLWFFIILKSITGLFCLFTCPLLIFFVISIRNKKFLRLGLISGFLILGTGITAWKITGVHNTYFTPQNDASYPDISHTPSGNPYLHDTLNPMVENGVRVGLYNCWKELEEEWPERSNMEIHGKDQKGNFLMYTLLRFLASKNLPRDSAGLSKLCAEEISAIERGIANVVYLKEDRITQRIHQVLYELEDYRNRRGNPSGHSIIQRLEFWRAGWHVWSNNFWLGVGAGDTDRELKAAYVEINSPLDEKFRLRPHNQFLSVAVATGIFGLLIFLTSLIYPFLLKGKGLSVLYLIFFYLAFFSFFSEDTLETQAGVTFYAFFNAWLFFMLPSYFDNISE